MRYAYKIAWESRRFWEQDYNIYGGLEFVNTGCSPVWFPSANMHTERGVFVSGYTDERDSPFGKLSMRGEAGREPQDGRSPASGLHSAELSEADLRELGHACRTTRARGFSGTGPGQERAPGVATSLRSGVPATRRARRRPGRIRGMRRSSSRTGRCTFCGDHVSHIVGWQEGAAQSSLRAVRDDQRPGEVQAQAESFRRGPFVRSFRAQSSAVPCTVDRQCGFGR